MYLTTIIPLFARLGAVAATIAMPLAMRVTPAGAQQAAIPDNRYVVPFSVLDGTPDFDPGQGLGYWLWRDQDGIHLRTTTHGTEHDFNGVLRTTDNARFVDVTPYHLEDHGANDDRVRVNPDHDIIRFHFDTWDGVDGVDFRVNGRAFCVELENNGHEATDLAHLGQDQLKPDQLPICFQRGA